MLNGTNGDKGQVKTTTKNTTRKDKSVYHSIAYVIRLKITFICVYYSCN